MKKLSKEAVCEIAEMLISKHGSTTTLDVKNHLRTRGYEAFQNEVSGFMQSLANEESWNFNNNGRYKIYSFGQDTQYSLEAYLEKENTFWKLILDKKKLLIEEGNIGENGLTRQEKQTSNRKAYKVGSQKIQAQKQAGFKEAEDKRLPLKIRNEFAVFLSQKAQTISLSFFNVEEVKEREGVLLKNNKRLYSYERLIYNTGKTFIFDINQITAKDFYFLHKNEPFDITKLLPTHTKTFGKKQIQNLAFDDENQTLTMENYQYFEANPKENFIVNNNVKKQCLYEIQLSFTKDKILILNRHTQDLDTIIIPLLLEILKK